MGEIGNQKKSGSDFYMFVHEGLSKKIAWLYKYTEDIYYAKAEYDLSLKHLESYSELMLTPNQ